MKVARSFIAVLAVAAMPLIAGADPSQETSDSISATLSSPHQSPATIRADLLDRLFARLVKATSDEEGQAVEQAIWKLWMASDSPTAELLLGQAVKVSAVGDNETALEILDKLIKVHPDFMEAWNRRATVYFLLGRYQESLSDIDQVLAREPRHFGALSGLGMIKRRLGDLAAARAAFSDALAVHPNMPGVKRALEELEREETPI
jgi:tetratricopeptide (TPR) repeat protein